MKIIKEAGAQRSAHDHAVPELKEIVMGLHWTPPKEGSAAAHADLDALCVLFDQQRRVLELIGPAHARNANDSVFHTGDSQRGTSEWDDERIFVFLDALPEHIASLAFIVTSASGQSFSEVPGASCHVSDRVTEHEWLRLELTALERHRAHCVAMLHRRTSGWGISAGSDDFDSGRMAELIALAGIRKPLAL
jgi:tellurium resistance protein TerZ